MRSSGYIAAAFIFFFILFGVKVVCASGGEDGGLRLKYLKRAYIETIYLEGERSRIPGIKASQHGLVYNNDGIEPEEGLSTYLGLDMEFASGPVSLYLTPLFKVEGGVGSGELHKGFVKLSFSVLDLEIGKRDLWWGQGTHGGLFLTNNAEPLKMLRLTNPEAIELPWIFRKLGPFRFDSFVSKLASDRDVPNPLFAGLRFVIKPHEKVEVGFTRTFIMGGDGRPGLTLERLFDIAFGDNKNVGEDLSNSIAGVDVRFTIDSFELYGELGGEDEAGGLPSKAAYIVGLYIPKLREGMDLRIEYADIRDKVWYRHGLYSSGYTYNGRILGHHVGGGGSDLFVELGLLETERVEAAINFDYEQRSVAVSPTTERHYQFGTNFSYKFKRVQREWTIDTSVYFEKVENARYSSGVERDNALVSINITGNI